MTALRGNSVLTLIGFLALCFGVEAVAAVATWTSVEIWYPLLAKPWFTLPKGAFGPVWTVLYAMMAVAAWLVWREAGPAERRPALRLFFAQLALNVLWPILFFGLQAVTEALIEIGLLLALVLATTLAFWRIDQRAGALFVPYLLWVTYAAALNAAIWAMN